MSVHKVPQDVEAEDKLLGPFTFKQMILLLIAAFIGFIMVLLARVNLALIAIPLPFFLIFLFFGIYRRKDQSVETYVAAILRFYFKPRTRIWDKDGILETVIITAPKEVLQTPIDNMNNMEVKNRLKTLGELMDTRGWSTKNASLQDGAMAMSFVQSDRLVTPTMTQEPTEIHDSDDMLDNYNSATAQNIAARTAAMQEEARRQALARMQQEAAVAPQMPAQPQQPQAAPAAANPTPMPTSDPATDIHYQPMPTMHQNVISPAGQDNTARNNPYSTPQPTPQPTQQAQPQQQSSSVMTTDVPADILQLSTNNDRTVESIAKEADQILESGDTISLHGN